MDPSTLEKGTSYLESLVEATESLQFHSEGENEMLWLSVFR